MADSRIVEFELKQGDLLPVLELVLEEDPGGKAIDLTGCRAYLIARPVGGGDTISVLLEILAPKAGHVRAISVPSSSVADYDLEVLVLDSENRPRRIPNHLYRLARVSASLGGP